MQNKLDIYFRNKNNYNGNIIDMQSRIDYINNLATRFPKKDSADIEEMKQTYRLALFEFFLDYQDSSSIKVIEEGDFNLEKFNQLSQYIYKIYLPYQKMKQELVNAQEKKINEINHILSEAFGRFSLTPPRYNKSINGGVVLTYKIMTEEEIEHFIQILFEQYNEKIGKINLNICQINDFHKVEQLKQEKIDAIADLYQMLEWLHPYIDGQGRTDLVLLSKILSEQGFSPPILEQPYTSSWKSLVDWKDDLLKGLELWKNQRTV